MHELNRHKPTTSLRRRAAAIITGVKAGLRRLFNKGGVLPSGASANKELVDDSRDLPTCGDLPAAPTTHAPAPHPQQPGSRTAVGQQRADTGGPACHAPNRSTGIRLGSPELGSAPGPVADQAKPYRTPSVATAEPSQRYLVIGDSENAVTPVRDTLRYAGLLNKRGALKRKYMGGLHILHTGDLLYKHQPDPEVARFWQCLRE